MVKVVARNRAGGFQRLVVMTEQEYEELRAASLLQNKKTGPANSLVEKYLDDNAHPGLSTSERLALYNQAVAREEATHQFTQGRYATSNPKPQRMDVPETAATTPKPQLADVPEPTQIVEAEPTQAAEADVKIDKVQEQDDDDDDTKSAKTDKLSYTLPNVRVPILHGPKLLALKTILESSGTIGVDNLDRVYINRTLLDTKSNYFDLIRSLFVHSKKNDTLVGRARFLEHLHKLGVSAKQVSTRSAKLQLQHLDSQPKQVGGKRHTKGSRPPGKRPKVLLMYR